jgi:hypothetical protein
VSGRNLPSAPLMLRHILKRAAPILTEQKLRTMLKSVLPGRRRNLLINRCPPISLRCHFIRANDCWWR